MNGGFEKSRLALAAVLRKLRVAGIGAVAALCVAGCACGCTVSVNSSTVTTSNSAASETVSQSYSFDDAVSAISIDMRAGNVSIVKGDKLTVACSFPEEYMPAVTCDSNGLSVAQDISGDITVQLGEAWNVTITVPESCAIQTVTADLDLGNLSVTGLDFSKLEADADLGDVTVKDCAVHEVDLEVDMGNVNATGSSFDTGDIEADLGDITLDGTFGSSLKMECDDSITVNGEKQKSDD